MIPLPDAISSCYRPASTRDVHSWSFGAIRAPRDPNATGWRMAGKTLNDEAVFGPKRDYECACGKYRGEEHNRMICDQCGVKITASASRRARFGHIDLPNPVQHPLGEPSAFLEAFPVMPAAFRESPAGTVLDPLYEEVLHLVSPFRAELVAGVLASIVQVILPVLVVSIGWNLREADLLARRRSRCIPHIRRRPLYSMRFSARRSPGFRVSGLWQKFAGSLGPKAVAIG